MFALKSSLCTWQLALLLLFSIFQTNYSQAESELDIIYSRRVQDIIQATHNEDKANQWRRELSAGGTWSDVDYTAGCPARRANWPAQEHFHRIITMASLWNRDKWDTDLRSQITLALDYWFDNDFHSDDCINAGGQDRLTCPCGTPGLWNTNWYCQMILMPGLVGNACLLLKSSLTATQVGNCTAQTHRAYVRIDGDPNGSMGGQTGANMLDVSSIGLSLALLTEDEDLMQDTLSRYYNEAQITNGTSDGIKIDGSFMQHSSQLYNGNYGQVFMRALIKIFIQTGNTSLAPPPSVHDAFLTVFNGSEWFMYLKNEENDRFSPILLWQFSVIGRMVSHKYQDWHGTGLNFDELLEGTRTWPNSANFQQIVQRLRSPPNNVNPGPLVGTRFFHASDYMVHRGQNYIVTLKMFSSRTTNSECNNNQNPFGFHLSDGTIYTYRSGDEYTNVYGAWDWNLIPGTTVDYGATPLACSRVQFKGKERFVGGVAFGQSGIAVMNYTDPMDESFRWCKTYFFFPNSYAVQFVGQAVATNRSIPVVTTLDQRQLLGSVFIDGQIVTQQFVRQTVQNIWHDRVGYQFLYPVDLTVDTIPRQSDWAAIGISQGNETQNIFAAYFNHPAEETRDDRFTYIAQLDVAQDDFSGLKPNSPKTGGIDVLKTGEKLTSFATTAVVRGATFGNVGSIGERIVSLAFLTDGEYDTGLEDIQNVVTDAPLLLLFTRKENGEGWRLAMADPSQTLTSVNIRVITSTVEGPIYLNEQLPQGNLAGSTAVIDF